MLLDLSATFDTIDHHHLFELLQKLFGIKVTAFDSMKPYLGNRSASIHINSKTSPTVTPLEHTKGQYFSHHLYHLHKTPLADIREHHDLSYHLYADDTQL